MPRKIRGRAIIDNGVLFTPQAAPSATQGLLYFDSTDQKLKVSNDGSTFEPAGPTGEQMKSLVQTSIISALNNAKQTMTAGYTLTTPDAIAIRLIDTADADTATNWTFDAGTKSYQNTQTAQATLQYNDILRGRQKNIYGTIVEAGVYIVFEDAGEEQTGLVSNPSFETAGGGGADVFANWTESIGTGITGSQTFTQGTGTGVTDGTFDARLSGSASALSSPTTSTLTQSVNVTGIKFLKVDYRITIAQTGGSALTQPASVSVSVGAVNSSAAASSAGPTTVSGTFILDVSTLTGSQTLTLSVSFGSGGWGSRTYTWQGDFDYVRTVKDGGSVSQLTRSIQMTADGSNWETVQNGEIHVFTNTGTVLGVRVVETRTNGSTLFKDQINEFGVLVIR